MSSSNETDIPSLELDIDREELVSFLLRTKKQIQYLSSVANCKSDTAEIQVYLRTICIHEKIWDSFDVGADESVTIEYCPKCETIFQK